MTLTRTRRATLSVAGLLLAGSLALTACGNTDATPAADAGTPAAVTSIDGQMVSLPASGKPTAVFFFSVGCG